MNDTPMRLDAKLVSLGLATGREKAKELIAGGFVTVNGKTVTKPSLAVFPDDEIVSLQGAPRFVGRGGYKLEKALDLFSLDLTDCVAADIGASTGGFTHCMLSRGAKTVFAIDVGKDQLHASLRSDSRVISLEQTDVRHREKISAVIPDHSIDFVSVDVSFISLNLVVPAVLPLLKPTAVLVCLIKPQFEAGRKALDKHGIVRSPDDHCRVLEQLTAMFCERSLSIRGLHFSPICGGDGNIEYLLAASLAESGVSTPPSADEIRRLVQEAHLTLKPKKGR